MITYLEIKDWLTKKENKRKLIVTACFVVIFLIGFGTGSYDRNANHNKLQSNYNTFQNKKPVPVVSKEGDVVGDGNNNNNNNDNNKQTLKAVATTSPASCIIKGNISATGKKIFHVQGGLFYKKVKPEQCFATETEAISAGFVKSGR